MEPTRKYPLGIVTFLFTDIEGYSTLEENCGALLQPVLEEHNRLLRELSREYHGMEVKTIGDAFFLVFDNPSNAVRFAVATQCVLQEFPWQTLFPESAATVQGIRIRIGMHTGEARTLIHPDGKFDYLGSAVNRAARISAAAHGGQILLSQATYDNAMANMPQEIEFRGMGRHRMKGVGEEHLWQLCAPDLSTEFPPLNTLSASRHNLPLPQTPFIGRKTITQECIALLQQSNTRLVTLLAFGGMGKSRLALQIAELCFDEFKDGVWWINVENATTGDEMVARIAEQLRLHLQPQPSVREQVWNFHRDRQMLLVLDNTEQVQGDDAANAVFELLNAGSQVKCLVTSRRALNIAAEHVLELAPLAAREAQSLFVQRAQTRKANFEINQNNADDVAAICVMLEGMPLAIEIAASLIVLLAPKQILKKLDDQLKVLVMRDPTRPYRQQALHAAIDWSHDLLSNGAKILFAQLAVFVGGFTFEAAEAICRGVDYDVFDGILELRNHSLLRSVTDENVQEERMTMLESVRSYAFQKLKDKGEEYSVTARQHAEHYLELLKVQTKVLRTHEEAEALHKMEVEFDNLRAALNWAAGNDAQLCAQLGVLFHHPLHMRGFWSEANVCLETAWSAAQSLGDEADVLRAQLRHNRAVLSHDMGELETANAEALLNLVEYQKLGDNSGEAEALNLLALLATETNDLDNARRWGEAALQRWSCTDFGGRAKTLHNMARLASHCDDSAEAQRLYEEALTLRKRVGDVRGEAETLGNLGVLAQNRGDLKQAYSCYRDSLKLRHTMSDRHGIAIMLHNLGELAETDHDSETAFALFTHAERIFQDLRSPYVAVSNEMLAKLRARLTAAEYLCLQEKSTGCTWEEILFKNL